MHLTNVLWRLSAARRLPQALPPRQINLRVTPDGSRRLAEHLSGQSAGALHCLAGSTMESSTRGWSSLGVPTGIATTLISETPCVAAMPLLPLFGTIGNFLTYIGVASSTHRLTAGVHPRFHGHLREGR